MRLTLFAATLLGGVFALALPDAIAQPAPPAPAAVVPAAATTAPTNCDTGPVDPYTNYTCLDKYLGTNPFDRLYNYYKLEWGQAGPPADPNAPPAERAGWPQTPETTPPMPFTEWPHGATTPIGVTRTGSVDSPLMVAIANTSVGQFFTDTGIQVYGWVDPGFNFSSNTIRKPGGNAPIAYAYIPNSVDLDQAVIYVDRFPDTVQTDHIDWGLRLSAIYGENYRYTTSYGIASYQLLKYNSVNGYDFPMLYGELYIPQVAEGLLIRVGRYISIPDIEAQLAPNNYMYTHSLVYSYDNYTNEGIVASLAITKNILLQLGVNDGTEAVISMYHQTLPNPATTVTMPNGSVVTNPLYGSTFYKNPGVEPSFTGCLRVNWNDGKDTVYPCFDGINAGQWGYNNLQWYGFTYYHKFDDHWHLSFEFYDLHQNGVPNLKNPVVQALNATAPGDYGTPFGWPYITKNAPNEAQCANATVVRCNAYALGSVFYLNYSPEPLDNFSLRPEVYDDAQGQRTGTAATYWEVSLGWQHWFSPQLEMRPEIGYYHSNGANAFNVGTRNWTLFGASDLIFHF